MNTIKYLISGLLFTLALAFGQAQAQQLACTYTEQKGCLEIDLMALHNDRHVPELQEILASGDPGKQAISKILEGDHVVKSLYRKAENGSVGYFSGCFAVTIRFFSANRSVYPYRMREYHLPQGVPAPKTNLLPHLLRARFVESSIVATDPATGRSYGNGLAYELNSCGGKTALQVPWDFLPQGAAVQIEIRAATEFPWKLKEATIQNTPVALWLTADTLDRFRDNQKPKEYILVPIIFPALAAR